MRALLTRLAAAGLFVALDGGKLQIRPGSRLTGALREELRSHKPALVAYLKAQERLPATIFSKRLGDRLILAPDGTPDLPIDGLAVYTPVEVQLLKGASDEMLIAVHNVKSVLGGRVEGVYDSTTKGNGDEQEEV